MSLTPMNRPLVLALAALALLSVGGGLLAFPPFFSTWQGLYPSSQTGDNVDLGTGSPCQLCHEGSGGGDGWNGYGWSIRELLESGSTLSEAILGAEPEDSDFDPTGSANLAEINVSTQPGWTPGPFNTIYFKDDTTNPGQLPPSDILGDLDPPLEGDIEVTPLALDFGVVAIATPSTLSFTIENTGAASVTVSGLDLAGSPEFGFATPPALPIEILPAASMLIEITYTPADDGADSGTVTVTSDDPDESEVEIALSGTTPSVLPSFLRGDCNDDGSFNIADTIALLDHLFGGSAVLNCDDACDANDDGLLDIADAIAKLDALFAGTGPLPEPSASCGADPTDDLLGCDVSTFCP